LVSAGRSEVLPLQIAKGAVKLTVADLGTISE
jgi:hypothetical protein